MLVAINKQTPNKLNLSKFSVIKDRSEEKKTNDQFKLLIVVLIPIKYVLPYQYLPDINLFITI